MDILLESIHKLKEDWEEPILDLGDIDSFPYISHFTDSVKKLFCILETGKLKPKNTNKQNAICFSYDVYIEHKRDPETFKYGIIFNRSSFIDKLEKSDLKLKPYHATAKRLNSGNKELRIKYIGQKDSNYYLQLTGYDFSTPIKITFYLYTKIKNHLLYLEKIDKNYILNKQNTNYNEFFGYDNAANGQNVYITSNKEYRKNYLVFEHLLPLLNDDNIKNLYDESGNVWKFRDIIKKYDFDYELLDLPNIDLKKPSKEEMLSFRSKFIFALLRFKRTFDDKVIWLNAEEADEIYLETDEAELRVETKDTISFSIKEDVKYIFIPEEIKDINVDEYKEEIEKLDDLCIQSDITLEEIKDFSDEILLYILKRDFGKKIIH